MVKMSEDQDYPQLLFALGTRCADWTSVPLDSVESVEVKDSVPCDDHTHPLVTLTLKEPDSPVGACSLACSEPLSNGRAGGERSTIRPLFLRSQVVEEANSGRRALAHARSTKYLLTEFSNCIRVKTMGLVHMFVTTTDPEGAMIPLGTSERCSRRVT
jgi:hypothetical protein